LTIAINLRTGYFEKMNILITGGTGFVGSVLCQRLHDQGHNLTVLTRKPEKHKKRLPSRTVLVSVFSEINSPVDVVINLAGEGIAEKRWTPERKKILEQSRIDLTADLVAFIRNNEHKPQVLISGSAVGYYGDSGSNLLTEFSEPHDEFSHRLCAAWESQALRAKTDGVRVCILRTGLVIGKNGGFLKKMLPSFRMGMGAKLADGKQWMSWIHMHDYLNMIQFLIDDKSLSGIFNATAPNPVTNHIFTKMLASVLHRPSFLTMPPSLLNMMFGDMAHLLITGQRVIPKKFVDAGFEFKFPALKPALEDVC